MGYLYNTHFELQYKTEHNFAFDTTENVGFFFNNCIVPMGFFPWEIEVALLRESQLRQSRTTQPTVRAGCFSVSIIHQTQTWTTGSLTCTQMLMYAIAQRGVPTA